MIVSGNNAVSGNIVSNLTIANGIAFPDTPSVGELFFRTDSNTLFIYNNSTWVKLVDNSLSEKQTEDSDLTSIANLTGVTGLLRKTSENSWSIDTNSYITATTIIGDISGSGATNIVLTLPNIVSANTYKSVTVNAKGQVTAGTNPTTLAGYGIVDSAPLSHTTDNDVHLTPAQNAWIDAITATSNEVNYLNGTTSAIQTQLNNKSSSAHTHIAKIGNGSSQQLSYDINTERFDIVAGSNVVLSFNDSTNALTISTTGTLSGNATTASTLQTPRTISASGDATWTTTFDGSADVTSVLTLPNIATAGTYKSVTVNAKGQVTAGTNPTTLAGYNITDAAPLSHTTDNTVHLTSAQNTWIDAITATSNEINYLIGATWNIQEQLNSKQTYGTGTTIASGESIIISAGASITITDPPINGTDAVNKNYVDSNLTGLSWKNSVKVATTANITLSGTQTIDGVAVVVNDRVLVKNQTNTYENGVYVVDAGAWVRSADMDGTTPLNEFNSAALFVEQGTTQTDTGWTQVSNVTTVGTSAIQFTQFNGAAGITAGTGLVKSGNVLDVNMGAGIAQLPTDEVGVDVYVSGGLMTTVDGTASSTSTNAQLSLTKIGTAGIYKSVTVDAYGRITAGTNPTTLAGYGITDAVTSSSFTAHNHTVDTLSNVTITSKASNDLLRWNGTAWVNATLSQIGLVTSNTAITPGTYTKVTVDAKGLVTQGGQTFTSSITAPLSPSFGDEWYDTTTDILFKYINDGANSSWVDIFTAGISSSTLATANTIVQRTASAGAAFNDITATTLTLSSVIAATGNGTQDIGAINNKFGTIYGTASSAQYADLAEKYTSDNDYESGTVVIFGGLNETTISNVEYDTKVAGVVTTNPAYLMNSDINGISVALTGRVPCKVVGPIRKGDLLVTSSKAGYAMAINENKWKPGCVIGKSLEDFSDVAGTIEIAVGRF
jgi:phage-related tail fiber protein